jgi:O-antigen/teichoic acid export membrane protein
MGLYGYFAGTLIALTITVPLALWFIRRDFVFKIDKTVARRIFEFGYPFVFAGLAYWIFGSMDRWMLAILSNSQEVGLYSIAFKFATIVTFVNTAFGQAWSPYAIKLMREDKSYRYVYSRIFSLWFFILAILGLIVTLFSQELLIMLTPEDYWPAADVLVVVVLGMVLFGTTQITALGISIEKKTKLLSHGAWITAIVNFVLNLLFIPVWGARGAALATLLSYMLLTGFFLYWTQRLHPIPLEKTKLMYACAVLCIAFFAYNFLHLNTIDMTTLLLKLFLVSAIFFGGIRLGVVGNLQFSNIWPSRG